MRRTIKTNSQEEKNKIKRRARRGKNQEQIRKRTIIEKGQLGEEKVKKYG